MSAAQLKTVDLESGITAAYRQVPERFDSSKPTLILLHTFTTHSCYYGQ